MKKVIYLAFVFLAVVGLGQQAQAQNSRRAAKAAMRAKSRELSKFTVKTSFGKSKQYAAVGAMLGASNYFGDLAPRNSRMSTSLPNTRTYMGVFYSKRINPNLAWRATLGWARIKSDDFDANRSTAEGQGRYERNLNFRNDVIEASFVGIVDVLPTDRGYLRRDFFNGYGLLGVSMFYHNPKGQVPTGLGLADEGRWIALQPLGTEGQGSGEVNGTVYKNPYGLIQPAILVGGGVKYRLNDKIDLGLEFAWRFTFTDYLDDVGGDYMKDNDAFTANKDALWYAMSNKSGLKTSSDGEARDLVDRTFQQAQGFTNPTPANYQNNWVVSEAAAQQIANSGAAQNWRRIKGYGVTDGEQFVQGVGNVPFVSTGAPRGLRALDGYTVTTFTGTYILEFRARTPKFR